MSATTDILQIWRRPAEIFRAKLNQGAREDRALAVLLGACGLMFVARWPQLAREAHFARLAAEQAGTPLDQVPNLQALMGITLFALMFFAPVLIFLFGTLTGVVLRACKVQISDYRARLSLFWALLATTPAMLLQGMIAGMVGPGAGLLIIQFLVALAFLWLWTRLLREAAKP